MVQYGCHVTCLNVSTVQNRRNETLTAEQNLADHIEVVYGDFENLLYKDGAFDVVWSQDALLHSGNRTAVVAEAARVCALDGTIVFTDPMQADNADVRSFTDLTPHLVRHYTRVLEELQRNDATTRRISGDTYVDHMQTGLRHWINAGSTGSLV